MRASITGLAALTPLLAGAAAEANMKLADAIAAAVQEDLQLDDTKLPALDHFMQSYSAHPLREDASELLLALRAGQ